MPDRRLIDHQSDLGAYAPPGHTGTVNVRLVEAAFCGQFEMVHGTIDVGCEAHTHSHDREAQAIYVLTGCATVTLGDDDPVDCGPGTIIRIPPMLPHHVMSSGAEPLRMVIIYSPPLPPRADKPL